jgi:hypothetical protein
MYAGTGMISSCEKGDWTFYGKYAVRLSIIPLSIFHAKMSIHKNQQDTSSPTQQVGKILPHNFAVF